MFAKGDEMIIIGHQAIDFSPFVKVKSVEDIAKIGSEFIVWFDTHTLKLDSALELAKHCHNFQVKYAVMIHTLEELVLFANLTPQFLLLDKLNKARAFQKVIEHYLLDCKLLCIIKSQKQIAKIAQLGIDGVIFKQVLEEFR